MSQHLQPMTGPIGKTRSPWGVWWLSGITLGIYYLVWYVKLNRELDRAAGVHKQRGAFAMWFGQCLPIVAWVGLAHTAERMSIACQRNAAPSTVSGGMAILSTMWFASHTRYLQRRANALWAQMQVQQAAAAVLPQVPAQAPAAFENPVTKDEPEPIA